VKQQKEKFQSQNHPKFFYKLKNKTHTDTSAWGEYHSLQKNRTISQSMSWQIKSK
jgi:hypothetical protein